MSSVALRTAVTDFIAANTAEKLIDMTGQFQEMTDFMADHNITLTQDPDWVGLDFFADSEEPITVPATNTSGKYRETGGIYIHVVGKAALGHSASLLTRGEVLRSLLRGRRIGSVLIDSVTPMNFGPGVTLEFQGGFMSGSFIASYSYEFDL